jgi:preprotein translocase subunit YajC
MLGILAQNGQQAEANPLVAFLPLVLMGVVFYFLLIRPQSQRRRAQMQMQSEIDVGDEVVTTAGIYGTIAELEDEYGTVILEVAPNTQIRMARVAIAQLVTDDEAIGEAETEEAEPGS